jgi:hypothetical protein
VSDEQLRLECLKLAAQLCQAGDDVLALAARLYDFLLGKAPT